MFSGKLSQCLSEPCFSASSDKKTADSAFWGAVSCALCSCCSCQGLSQAPDCSVAKPGAACVAGLPSDGNTALLAAGFCPWAAGSGELWATGWLSPGFCSWWHLQEQNGLGGGLWQPLLHLGTAHTLTIRSSKTEINDGCFLCARLLRRVCLRGGNAAPHCYILSFFPMVRHWDKSQA